MKVIRDSGLGRPMDEAEEQAHILARLCEHETIHIARPLGMLAARQLEAQRLVTIREGEDLDQGLLIVTLGPAAVRVVDDRDGGGVA